MPTRDPLDDPEPLIRRVYAYVAYRIGEGPEAEDVVGDVFERAIRYRESFDPRRGTAAAWLVGIARRELVERAQRRVEHSVAEPAERADPRVLEDDAVRRLSLAPALARLTDRERELVALRYGADLSARQIGELLETRTNAIEVALHRALIRLRGLLRTDLPHELNPKTAAERIPGDELGDT